MCEKRCKEIALEILSNKKIKYIMGIHRGGLIPAVRISHLTGLPMIQFDDVIPHTNVAIIEDVIDTGRTRKRFEEYKYFFALVDKQKEKIKEWIVFWWEEK
jgi:adenine/guanine phosphoribosyltransferase-like PRPP-binding protein